MTRSTPIRRNAPYRVRRRRGAARTVRGITCQTATDPLSAAPDVRLTRRRRPGASLRASGEPGRVISADDPAPMPRPPSPFPLGGRSRVAPILRLTVADAPPPVGHPIGLHGPNVRCARPGTIPPAFLEPPAPPPMGRAVARSCHSRLWRRRGEASAVPPISNGPCPYRRRYCVSSALALADCLSAFRSSRAFLRALPTVQSVSAASPPSHDAGVSGQGRP